MLSFVGVFYREWVHGNVVASCSVRSMYWFCTSPTLWQGILHVPIFIRWFWSCRGLRYSMFCCHYFPCHHLTVGSHTLWYLTQIEYHIWLQTEESEQESLHELFECSVDVLANLDLGSSAEVPNFFVREYLCFLVLFNFKILLNFYHFQVSRTQHHQSVRLPRQLRDPLLHETETFILTATVDKGTENRPLSDVFSICALLSNFIHYSYLTRSVSLILLVYPENWMLIQKSYWICLEGFCFNANSFI